MMLGPVGKLAKFALERAGYKITRPTRREREMVGSFWRDWFSKDPELFGRVYDRNRRSLAGKNWTNSIEGSLWRYGVPSVWNPNDIESEITYSDLIGFVASGIKPLRYLEIGVSVGKNFWQIAELFPEAAICGLDVEKPNPSLVRLFDRIETIWEGPEQRVKTLSGDMAIVRLTHYHLHRNGAMPVLYVQGDQFAPETWASIRTSFNFIFSDGVHSGRAIRDEMAHLKGCKLVDPTDKFVMYWDDLVNVDMQDAFADNLKDLGDGQGAMYWIHGTYGERRLNGLFARL